MLELLNNLFDVQEILSQGIDVAIYFFMGLVGFVLLVIRLAITLLFGDFDADFDIDTEVDMSHDASFGLFSVLSMLAFFTAVGWTGVICRMDLELSPLASAPISFGVGAIFMLAAAAMMFAVRRMESNVQYEVADAVGKTATVYLTIPPRGQGTGQVTVTVSGRRMTMNAISTGESIAAFAEVTVKAVQDDETLVVEAKYPAAAPSEAQ